MAEFQVKEKRRSAMEGGSRSFLLFHPTSNCPQYFLKASTALRPQIEVFVLKRFNPSFINCTKGVHTVMRKKLPTQREKREKFGNERRRKL